MVRGAVRGAVRSRCAHPCSPCTCNWRDVGAHLAHAAADPRRLVAGLSESADVRLQSPSSPEAMADGTDVALTCDVDGSDDIRIEWFR